MQPNTKLINAESSVFISQNSKDNRRFYQSYEEKRPNQTYSILRRAFQIIFHNPIMQTRLRRIIHFVDFRFLLTKLWGFARIPLFGTFGSFILTQVFRIEFIVRYVVENIPSDVERKRSDDVNHPLVLSEAADDGNCLVDRDSFRIEALSVIVLHFDDDFVFFAFVFFLLIYNWFRWFRIELDVELDVSDFVASVVLGFVFFFFPVAWEIVHLVNV